MTLDQSTDVTAPPAVDWQASVFKPLTPIEYATLDFVLAWIRAGNDVILVNRQPPKEDRE